MPENTDLSALHYFVAVDADDGENGEINYSLVDGAENKFSVDAHTGTQTLTNTRIKFILS